MGRWQSVAEARSSLDLPRPRSCSFPKWPGCALSDEWQADFDRLKPPPGTRLVLVAEDADTMFFGRAYDGDRLTFVWGEPDDRGWYAPRITKHSLTEPEIRELIRQLENRLGG